MIYTLYKLVGRNIKIYLKDKANVFFSLLSPLIILGLYVLFIGKLQIDGLNEGLKEMGITGADKQVRAFCDSWMLTGVMACACITVALCSSGVVIRDKQLGISADVTASPVPRWLPMLSYVISVVVITFVICMIVLAVCFIYLAAIGNWYMSVSDVFGCIGVTALSVLSSSTVVICIASLIKTEGAFSGVNIIMGTLIGFLIGAYMPISTFPKPIQYLTLFIPGSYSAGLYRNFFMGGALEELSSVVPAEGFLETLAKDYSMTYDFFGAEIAAPAMAGVLAGFIILFGLVDAAIIFLKRKNKG